MRSTWLLCCAVQYVLSRTVNPSTLTDNQQLSPFQKLYVFFLFSLIDFFFVLMRVSRQTGKGPRLMHWNTRLAHAPWPSGQVRDLQRADWTSDQSHSLILLQQNQRRFTSRRFTIGVDYSGKKWWPLQSISQKVQSALSSSLPLTT